MYSNKKIPAPFDQPRFAGGKKTSPANRQPASPPQMDAEKKNAVPIAAKEKTMQKKAVPHSSSPLLAFLLYDIFSNKEG